MMSCVFNDHIYMQKESELGLRHMWSVTYSVLILFDIVVHIRQIMGSFFNNFSHFFSKYCQIITTIGPYVVDNNESYRSVLSVSGEQNLFLLKPKHCKCHGK